MAEDQEGGGGAGRMQFRVPSANTITVAPGTNSTSTAPDGSKVADFFSFGNNTNRLIMATFCELDPNNIVIRAIKVGNEEVPNGNGDVAGETYCNRLLSGTWKQTSFNTIGGIHHIIDEDTGVQSVNPDQN